MNLLPVARCLGNWQHATAGGPWQHKTIFFAHPVVKPNFMY